MVSPVSSINTPAPSGLVRVNTRNVVIQYSKNEDFADASSVSVPEDILRKFELIDALLDDDRQTPIRISRVESEADLDILFKCASGGSYKVPDSSAINAINLAWRLGASDAVYAALDAGIAKYGDVPTHEFVTLGMELIDHCRHKMPFTWASKCTAKYEEMTGWAATPLGMRAVLRTYDVSSGDTIDRFWLLCELRNAMPDIPVDLTPEVHNVTGTLVYTLDGPVGDFGNIWVYTCEDSWPGLDSSQLPACLRGQMKIQVVMSLSHDMKGLEYSFSMPQSPTARVKQYAIISRMKFYHFDDGQSYDTHYIDVYENEYLKYAPDGQSMTFRHADIMFNRKNRIGPRTGPPRHFAFDIEDAAVFQTGRDLFPAHFV